MAYAFEVEEISNVKRKKTACDYSGNAARRSPWATGLHAVDPSGYGQHLRLATKRFQNNPDSRTVRYKTAYHGQNIPEDNTAVESAINNLD